MRTWSRHWRRVWQKRRPVRRPRSRPILECLEERCLLDSSPPIIPNLTPTPQLTVSTVPANGDLNPYGVAVVPNGFATGGPLSAGDVLVSNFNDSANVQGTGTTIVQITPAGNQSLFFQNSATPGLTTALGTLKRGFVLVGNVPTTDGTFGTIQQGSLQIIDKNGNQVADLTSSTLLDGPWDLAVHDQGEIAQVFVANVLSGTVTRIDLNIPTNGNPTVQAMTQIASGYTVAPNAAAVVVGPTGLAYDADHDILYVASTADNEIFSIAHAKTRTSDAGMGTLVYQDNTHLHGPLGLVLTPNGDLISAQGDAVNPDPSQPSELVEFTPAGQFVAQTPVDSTGLQGGAFGVALQKSGHQITFAAVDDSFNALEVWTINTDGKPEKARFDRAIGEDASAAAARGDPIADAGVITALVMAQADSGSRAVPSLPAAPLAAAVSPQSLVPLPIGESVGATFGAPTGAAPLVRPVHRAAVDLAFADFRLDPLA